MIIFGIMAVSTALSIYLLLQVMLGTSSRSWPSTEGKLVKFKMKRWTVASKFPSITGEVEQCLVAVKYSYKVEGKVYKSRRINFGMDKYYLSPQGLYRTPEEVENDELTRLLKNDQFRVHYSPVFPAIAVLVTGVLNVRRHYKSMVILMAIGSSLSLAYFLLAE
jgi:hypothetical protein